MFAFLAKHATEFNVAVSLATLVVWVLYFQILYRTYRNTNTSNILITRGAGKALDSQCLVSNLSSSPIYVASVIASVEIDGETIVNSLTDLRDLYMSQEHHEENLEAVDKRRIHQGVLSESEFMSLGRFSDLITLVLWGRQGQEILDGYRPRINSVEVTVIANFGTYRDAVGARRRFLVARKDGREELKIETLMTKQMRSRSERKMLMRELAKYD